MPFSRLPAILSTFFLALASWLDRRSGGRLPALLCGILFAKGRRTVTSWFRKAGVTDDFRNAYTAVNAAGRAAGDMAISALQAVRPLLGSGRLLVAIDDTPTERYGPEVEGAGIHRHPSAGPANERFLYGHVLVTLAALARHPEHGVIALPLEADLYIREKDVPELPPERGRVFQTKLELAAEQMRWLGTWTEGRHEERWAVVDGGYANRPFLDAARKAGFVVVGRLRKDAALFDLPAPRRPRQKGAPRKYGEGRISLAGRGAHPGGWGEVECEQYGERVTKTVKTFLATWRPARGVVRVVMVWEEDHWLAFFSTKADATAAEGRTGGGRPQRLGAGVQGREGGVGGRRAAGAERGLQRGVLQPEPVDDVDRGGVGVGQGRGRVGGPRRQPVGQPAEASVARGQAQGVAA